MKPKPATLVILTPGFPSDEQDSTCLPPQQVFVRALNRVFPGLKVVILSLEYPHRAARYDWFGNRVVALGGWRKSKVNKLFTLVAAWRWLVRLRRDHDLVGLLSWWCGPCALVGKYFASRRGLSHFTWILGQDARAGNGFVRLIRPGRDQLVAMSASLADEFGRNYGIRPLHIVPNGIDPGLFEGGGVARGGGVESGGAAARDIDVLGVGNLTALKRYDIFVSVVDGLSHTIPSVRGIICGKGAERPRLEQTIGELGLKEKVELSGELPHREVLQLMMRSKILLHTSSYEGFSTVCIEALYAGAHVISFVNTGGSPIKNWHVVNSEEEMLAKAMELLQSADTVYESVQPFTMDNSVRAMMALYGYKDVAIE